MIGGPAQSDDRAGGGPRGQTSLAAVATALLILTLVTGVALAIADGALASAEREAGERRAAASLAARLVAADAPLTARENVLNASRLESLDASRLASRYPVARGRAVRVRVGGTTAASTGAVTGGTTIRRLVLVERSQPRRLRPDLDRRRSVTLPRRAGSATLVLSPPSGSTIETVRADERVVLHDDGGLRGTFTVDLSRYETTRLAFAGAGSLPEGSVEIRYAPPETTKATLAVTVDA